MANDLYGGGGRGVDRQHSYLRPNEMAYRVNTSLVDAKGEKAVLSFIEMLFRAMKGTNPCLQYLVCESSTCR